MKIVFLICLLFHLSNSFILNHRNSWVIKKKKFDLSEVDKPSQIDDKLPNFNSSFMDAMSQRGYLYQCTDSPNLDSLFQSGCIKAYIGFDPTAPALHIGSLVQIMILRLLQSTGHKPIIVLGGGTAKIGDPTGKDESRQLMNQIDISKNAQSLIKIFEKFLHFGNGKTDAVIMDNSDWIDSLNYIDFLRDYGKYFSVNKMLTHECIKQRLLREQSLSFLEFNYLVLQAYDFLELSRKFNVTLQIGGSDQWGNIVSGIELARKIDSKQLYGLTTPLITNSEGNKMGKTANGAIWLDK